MQWSITVSYTHLLTSAVDAKGHWLNASGKLYPKLYPKGFSVSPFNALVLAPVSYTHLRAQNDPTLAGMILMYTNKAEKELKNQEKVMLLQSTGHRCV